MNHALRNCCERCGHPLEIEENIECPACGYEIEAEDTGDLTRIPIQYKPTHVRKENYAMPNRELVMLAETYDFQHHVSGFWYASEKLDGMRCWWDGGVTRGQLAKDVLWANVEKDARLTRPSVSTGLWSRYGKVIHCPSWYLDTLPQGLILDGELWLGHGRFQELRSIVSQHTPMRDWEQVRFMVFEIPPPQIIFMDGRINNPNYKKDFIGFAAKMMPLYPIDHPTMSFRGVEAYLKKSFIMHKYITAVSQELVPVGLNYGKDFVKNHLKRTEEDGGEGLMLRKADSYWTPRRSKDLLKVISLQTAEATVIGYVWGEETEKGSKLLGLMGALICQNKDKIFNISGFSNPERELYYTASGLRATQPGYDNPGKPVEAGIQSLRFPLGSKVTYKFKGLTDEGLPREPRYGRPYIEE